MKWDAELLGFGSGFLSLVVYAILGVGLGSTVWCGLVGWVRLQLAFFFLPLSLSGWGVGTGFGPGRRRQTERDGRRGKGRGHGMAVVVPGFRFMGRYSLGRWDTKVCVVLLHLPLGGFFTRRCLNNESITHTARPYWSYEVAENPPMASPLVLWWLGWLSPSPWRSPGD